MVAVLDGLKQVGQYFSPRVLMKMREAGAVHPKGPIAMFGSLPWLLGRGPSLGIVSQMNSFVLGDKVAIHDRRGELSFAELDARANRVLHMLTSAGVKPGDSVGMVLRNGREMIEIALGCQKAGIVACPFNTWAKTKELKNTIDNAGVSVLIYDTAHAEQVKSVTPVGVRLFHVGDDGHALEDSRPYEEEISSRPTSPPFPFTLDRGAPKVIIHTSGTTGTPKGAQRNAAAAGVRSLANILTVVPYRRDDVVLCPAPLFHSFGLATFTFATALGATLVLPERFDPEGCLQAIERHRATAASFVPVMIRRIVSLPEEKRKAYDLSSLRVVMASGSALSEDLRRAARELFGDVIYDLYGSTEVGWVAIATPEDMRARPKAVGKPVPGIEIAVFSQDGERLGPNEPGELFIKSEVLFEGYTSGESKDVRDGYMTIGDVGRIDEEGFLFIEGRADDMVVVGGENIYPIEIEGVIEDIDGVEEVAVLGVPDDEYGEVLAAFVVGSVDGDQIEKVCRAELASYKVPKRIEVVDELPRNATGKVLKRELVKLAAAQRGESD